MWPVRGIVAFFQRLAKTGGGSALAEEGIPVDAKGKPDLSRYTQPVEHYMALYRAFLSTQWKDATPQAERLAWNQRVHGTWGLLAKGAQAAPFLLALITNANADAREDAAFLLGQLKSEPGIGEQLVACLREEPDLVARSAMINALGRLRYRPAVPALASIIRNADGDADSRWDAATSLGRVVGQDFSGDDALAQAERWLEEHPDRSMSGAKDSVSEG